MQKLQPCNCDPECPDCAIGLPFQRNHYFTGKLLVERDFRQEQDYYVDKFKHHHQRLHGTGVVCGLKVVQHESPPCRDRFLCVEPGTAIDCCGREIVVRERECIDVTKLPGYKKLAEPSPRDLHDFQLCIRYRECPTEDIPVLFDDCGCNDAACAPNRILESYEFDVIVDPPPAAPSPNTPKVEWTNTLFNIADVVNVAIHDASRRLYAVTLGNPNVIYQLNLDNNVVLAPLVLPEAATGLAVSPDGSRIYVSLATNPLRRLLVIDTTTFTQVRTVDIPDSAGSRVELACGSGGHLYGLVNAPGRLQRWDLDINTAAAPAPVPLFNIVVAGKARSLVLSSDSARAYALESPGMAIVVADTTTGAVLAPINVMPPGTTTVSLALVRSGAQDELAVAGAGASPRIHLVGLAPTALLGSSNVSHPPVDVVAAPDGKWAYALVRAAGKDFVQPVNLSAIRTGQPAPPGSLTPAGDQTQELEISGDGTHLYAPYLGSDPNSAEDGSLAILEITGQACCEKFWDSLNGCPSCETGDCVVLAGIRNYRPGFQMLDLPAGANDVASSIARIDNRDGRKLLPSTQTMAEVIECLCETAGGTGRDGQPGADGQPGEDGDDGIGLNPNLPKILDIGWVHRDTTVTWEQFRTNLIYTASPAEVVNRWPQVRPLLTVYFNNPMREINRETWLVSLKYPQCWLTQVAGGASPIASFSGLYNIFNLDIYGYLLELPKPAGDLTPHTGEDYQSVWAFIPDNNIFLHPTTRALIEAMGWLANRSFDRDQLSVHITLKGDFLWAGTANTLFSEDRLLDADNYGGRVGLNVTRGGLITGGKNPSGDMVIGGDFESWFFLRAPDPASPTTTTVPANIDLTPPFFMFRATPVNINTAAMEELAAVPRMTAALAGRIIQEREKGTFRSMADLKKRLKLSEDEVASIQPLLAFEK